MKTIAITISHGLLVRNLLRTDVLGVLKADRGIRVAPVILPLTSFYGNKEFAAEFNDKNVAVVNWPHKLNGVEWMLRKLEDMAFFNINHVETIKIKEDVLRKKNFPKWLLFAKVKKILGRNRNLLKAMEMFDRSVFSYKNKKYWEVFGENKPSLVFSTDFLCTYDWGLVKAAKHFNVPVIAMVASWDHLTKGMLPTKFDRVIVWNDFLKEQLIDYYGYKPEEIFVSGIPQFDYYVKLEGKALPRAKFLREVGAKPSQKLITYTTSPPTLAPYEQDVIEMICEAIKGDKIKYPAHLHVRFHPGDDFRRYEKLQKYSDILTFERPGKSISSANYVWNPDLEDMTHYVGLLKNSDVVINVCSTVSIDASAFDTPVINIAFDGREQRPYWDSTRRYYDYTHYKRIVRTKGVRAVKSEDELIKGINDYLADPALDRAGRRRIVKEMSYKFDGRSGERIAKYILKFLNERGG